jgi:hypothetical protein
MEYFSGKPIFRNHEVWMNHWEFSGRSLWIPKIFCYLAFINFLWFFVLTELGATGLGKIRCGEPRPPASPSTCPAAKSPQSSSGRFALLPLCVVHENGSPCFLRFDRIDLLVPVLCVLFLGLLLSNVCLHVLVIPCNMYIPWTICSIIFCTQPGHTLSDVPRCSKQAWWSC